MAIPSVTLADGNAVPQLGFGTWRLFGDAAREPYAGWMAMFLGAMVPGIALGAFLTLRRGESASVFAMSWMACAAVLSWLLVLARSKLTRARRPGS